MEELGRLQIYFQSQFSEEKVNSASEVLPGFSKVQHQWQCNRCGNHDPEQISIGPCVNCQKGCRYCLACLQMGKVKQCSVLVATAEKEQPFAVCKVEVHYKSKLSDEQAKISQELVQLYREKKVKEHLVWAVTGAGKTEMIFAVLRAALENGGRVAIAAPRIDVCNELAPRLLAAFPTVEQIVLHGLNSVHYRRCPLTIATTHQLLRFYQAFDVLIVDEVDAFPYADSDMLQLAVQRAVKAEGLIIQMTATPSKQSLAKIKQGRVSFSLLPARYHRHPLAVPDFIWYGDWQKSLKQQRLPFVIYQWMQQRIERKQPFLIFVSSITQISAVENLLAKRFPNATFSSVSSVEENRVQRVQAMRQQEYDFLITTTILERGVSFEEIDVCVLEAHERIFSREVLVQIAGRVGRSVQHPVGDVVFFHNGITTAMKQARDEIQQLNQKAKSLGLVEA